MKAALIGLLAVAAVTIGIGTYLLLRSDGGSPTLAYAQQLDALCLDARHQVEALGRPSTTPMSRLYPGTVRIGRTFVQDVKRLQPPPEQAQAAKTFVQESALYYDGLDYAYQFLTAQKNQTAFVRIVDGAVANLANAETAAKAIGAKECMLRPFE
jgi:hypothetical protein